MIRSVLEAHRERGTLHKALECPCRDEQGIYRVPLLHHIITLGDEGAPPRERVAIARLLVKEFGADAISAYACGDVATPLLTAVSQGEVELMDFLISGKSALRSELLLSPCFSYIFPLSTFVLRPCSSTLPSDRHPDSSFFALSFFPLPFCFPFAECGASPDDPNENARFTPLQLLLMLGRWGQMAPAGVRVEGGQVAAAEERQP
jgi:hypothetical protein